MSRVTIKDVAKEAGVSTTTVSRVLNGMPDCSLEVQRRIKDIALEMGYRANYFARGMRGKSTNILGLVIPFFSTVFSSLYFNELLEALEHVLSDRGFRLMLLLSGSSTNTRFDYGQLFNEPLFDGFIIIAPTKSDIERMSVEKGSTPYVIMNSSTDQIAATYIDADNYGGALQAVNHLIEIGRKRIVYLGGPSDVLNNVERLNGYKQALKDHNIPIDDKLIMRADYDTSPGYMVTIDIIKSRRKFDAIFAFDDNMAVSAIQALKERNIKIPDDVAVVGFDDVQISQIIEPRLTTIHQPFVEMSKKALDVLIELIKNKDNPVSIQPRKIIIPTNIIIRESTSGIKAE